MRFFIFVPPTFFVREITTYRLHRESKLLLYATVINSVVHCTVSLESSYYYIQTTVPVADLVIIGYRRNAGY
jgi:hypothetical protein